MVELRQLTCQERREAIDPDASTTAPWPTGSDQPCIHRCEERRPLTEEEVKQGFDYDSSDPEYHPLDCTCIFCIPGA